MKRLILPFEQLQDKGCLYCFKMSCNTSPQLTFKMVPQGTVLNRKILLLFLPISQPQQRHNSNKTQSLKSPYETSVFTHENPTSGCTEVLERINTSTQDQVWRETETKKSTMHWLISSNSETFHHFRDGLGYAGAPLTQQISIEISH